MPWQNPKQNSSRLKRLCLWLPGLSLFYIKSSLFLFLQQNQVPPSYTDSGRGTPPDEPFDLARQEYSVIPPVLPNPSKKDWEIPRESLVFVKVIGKGAFGQVAKGMAMGIDSSKENRLVAIKMLRGAMCIIFLICVCICLWHLTLFFFSSLATQYRSLNSSVTNTVSNLVWIRMLCLERIFLREVLIKVPCNYM